jgi:hypothetical protein
LSLWTDRRDWCRALSIPDSWPRTDEPSILLTCHDVDRGLEREGEYFSPLLSPIGEYYHRTGRRIVNLSHPLTLQRSEQVFRGAISLNRAYIGLGLRRRLAAGVLGRQRALRNMRERQTKVYESILAATQARLIFSIQPPHELCLAAHRSGVAVVEAMHGMNLHPSDRIIRNLFEGVPDEQLPDTYLAFDDRTEATLRGHVSERAPEVRRVPHPWHVEVARATSPLVASGTALDQLLQRFEAAVLVTMQWGYDGERASLSGIIPNGIMHPALEQAILHSPREILWLLRLHPIQIKQPKYAHHRAFVERLSARAPNVEAMLASSLPLPLLLSRCRGHISMTSGSAGEAAMLAVPSLMLCPTLRPGGAHAGWFSELMETGLLTLGELDAERIGAWVRRTMERPAMARTRVEGERERLEGVLESLLGGSA